MKYIKMITVGLPFLCISSVSADEINSTHYTITGDIDIGNVLTPNTDISYRTFDSRINIHIPDTTKLDGDRISFISNRTTAPANNVNITLPDGTVIGKTKVTNVSWINRDIAGSQLNNLTKQDPDHEGYYIRNVELIFNNEFLQNQRKNVDIQLSWKNYVYHAWRNKEMNLTMSLQTSDGRILDSFQSKMNKHVTHDKFEPLKLKDFNNFTMGRIDVHEFDTSTNINITEIGYFGTETNKARLLPKGSRIKISPKNLKNIGFINEWGIIPQIGKPFTKANVGDTGIIRGSLNASEESPTNEHGYYTTFAKNVRFRIVSFDDGIEIELLDDLQPNLLFEWNLFLQPKFTPTTLPADFIQTDGTVSEKYRQNVYDVTITNPQGESYMKSYDVGSLVFGTRTNADGQLVPKYNSILRAKLGNGTIINDNVDTSGLRPEGTAFTLRTKGKIRHNGIWYRPTKKEVTGATNPNQLYYDVVYVYDDEDNAPPVDVETKDVPFNTVTTEDPNLNTGVTVVDREGTPGRKQVTKTWRTNEGIPTGEPTITEKVIKDPIDKLVRVGTGGTTTESRKEPIPFATEIIEDETMDKGTERVTVEGVTGEREYLTTYKTVKGQKVGQPISETNHITKEVVTKIIHRGVRGSKTEVENVNIPYTTRTVEDDTLPLGVRKTVQEGQNGIRTITRTWTTQRDLKVGDPTVSVVVSKEPREEIIHIGTREFVRNERYESLGFTRTNTKSNEGQNGHKLVIDWYAVAKGKRVSEVTTTEHLLRMPINEVEVRAKVGTGNGFSIRRLTLPPKVTRTTEIVTPYESDITSQALSVLRKYKF